MSYPSEHPKPPTWGLFVSIIICILLLLGFTGCASAQPPAAKVSYHRGAKEFFSVEIPQPKTDIITTIVGDVGNLLKPVLTLIGL